MSSKTRDKTNQKGKKDLPRRLSGIFRCQFARIAGFKTD